MIIPKGCHNVFSLLEFCRENYQNNVHEWQLILNSQRKALYLDDSTTDLFNQWVGNDASLQLLRHPVIHYVPRGNMVSSWC